MAEKRYIKGLFKDTSHLDQPEGTWRYAKNMVINEKMGSISNEEGTSLSGHLGTAPRIGAQNDKVIGAIEVNADRTVLFVVGVPTAGITARSEIGIWEQGRYKILFNPAPANFPQHDLNFQLTNPINGTFKVDSKGDLVVYFTDDLNPPRAFNVDRQIRESGTFTNRLYGMGAFNHIDILNLFPYAGSVPHIWIGNNWSASTPNQPSVKEGGGLRTGVYYLGLAYVDDDFVATNYLTVSNPIPIVDEYDHTRPTTKKDGMKEGSQTTKSITWRVSNLNTDYKFMRPVVIRKMGEATEAFKLNDIEINLNSAVPAFQDVTFSGIEGFSTGSLEEVIIDTTSYDTAKTINQLDGVLYVGNTTGSKDVGYQKYANNIKLNSVVKTITEFDIFWATVDNFETGFGGFPVDKGNVVDADKSYRYVPNTFKYKGYTRDETYAFYIAFILNDGSMSYAYHIPGRASVASTMEISNPCVGGGPSLMLYCDLEDVSPTYSKMFHWRDYSTIAGNRQMNYWHNATETYPTTENYEVWDAITPLAPLHDLNVRHHHFPGNFNNNRKSITDECCSTEDSDGVVNLVTAMDGSFRMMHQNQGCETSFPVSPWRRATFFQGPFAVTGNGAYIASTCWSCACSPSSANANNPGPQCWFTADQEMDVGVSYHMFLYRYSCGGAAEPSRCRIRTDASNNGGVTTVGSDTIDDYGNCGMGCHNDYNAGSGTIHLMPGEHIWVECTGQTSGGGSAKARQARPSNSTGCDTSCDGPANACLSTVSFSVLSTTAQADPDWYSDAKICHEVDILGFELEDIKIPESIADQVQGFRIYRADRTHANRTILGQAPLLPMSRHYEQLGICTEANNSLDVKEILKNLQDNPEFFWHVDPWPLKSGTELSYSLFDEVLNTAVTKEGYKNFSFHCFYLLNSKNSLSPATHIKPIYKVINYAWNGTAVDQDKKPLTEVVVNAGVKSIQTNWGWEAELNCYPQSIHSAYFIGKTYQNQGGDNTFRIPRLLGQKAKTYLRGDSIFEGTDLGFGGKVFNEFGTSCSIFGLKDGHEVPADWALSSPDGSLSYGGVAYTSASPWDDYGSNMLGHASMLTNPDHQGAPDGEPSHDWRSQYWIVNLGAFKTDLYKSIDSNSLVWTGYEVLGNQFATDDLKNFIFDDNTGAPLFGGDYKTSTIDPEGIFGGDTFISRYGFPVTLKPSNAATESNPIRAIHYQILEATDNVNFRHVESADSFYFPNTPARTMIQQAGNTDFNHPDNLKYNNNYSLDNDVRTAFPLPLRDTEQTDFPTRTHRSAKNDTTSLIDNYRVFLANQFKDLPKNRGQLWKLSSFNNLLYFHMEESLFAAQGKQTMSMKDGSEAFVGSGDIFAQEPNEMIQTEGGFAGTTSMYAAITTRFGYFFVDQSARKVFMMTEKASEISNIGMGSWFRDNLPFELESLGFTSKCLMDNPIVGLGFHAIWDPKFKRILLTKRDFKPTQYLLDGIALGLVQPQPMPAAYGTIFFDPTRCKFRIWQLCGVFPASYECWVDIEWECVSHEELVNNPYAYFECTGWTISFYPELGIWGSFHDYLPYIYFNTSKDFYSLTDEYARPVWTNPTAVANHVGTTYGNAGIWKHGNSTLYGVYYKENDAEVYTNAEWLTTFIPRLFEFEYIHNELKADTLLHSSFDYTLETFNQTDISVLEHGFTSFLLYNTHQISGIQLLEYLVNIRRVGNEWKVNNFRDMAAIAVNTNPYYMSTNPNVTGQINTGTVTSSDTVNMFTVAGMNETVNATYLDLAKNWTDQKKFIDKWIGIRLIYDNISNNLLNLYSTNVAVRKMIR